MIEMGPLRKEIDWQAAHMALLDVAITQSHLCIHALQTGVRRDEVITALQEALQSFEKAKTDLEKEHGEKLNA